MTYAAPSNSHRPRRLPARAKSAYQSAKHLSPIILIVYACLLPRELTVSTGATDLRAYFLVMVACIPAMWSAIQRKPLRMASFDWLVLFIVAWFMVSLAATTSASAAFTRGLSQAVEFGLAYAMGRAFIRTPRDFIALFTAVLPGIVIAGFFVFLESVSHRVIVHSVFSAITGHPPPYFGGEVRLGLMRGAGPYIHPIIAGLFHGSLVPFVLFSLTRSKDRVMGWFCILCILFAMSSTGFLIAIINAVLCACYMVQKGFRLPMLRILAAGTFVFLLYITLFSQNGLMSFVVRHLALNSASGYYRIAIWDYAGAEANAHPLFGIGLRDWIRPAWMGNPTVDSQWLVLTMMYGYPMSLATAWLMIGSALLLTFRRNRWPTRIERDTCMAIAFSIISTAICGLTVALWEGTYIWLIMLCGLAISIARGPDRAPAPRRPGTAVGRSSPYRQAQAMGYRGART